MTKDQAIDIAVIKTEFKNLANIVMSGNKSTNEAIKGIQKLDQKFGEKINELQNHREDELKWRKDNANPILKEARKILSFIGFGKFFLVSFWPITGIMIGFFWTSIDNSIKEMAKNAVNEIQIEEMVKVTIERAIEDIEITISD